MFGHICFPTNGMQNHKYDPPVLLSDLNEYITCRLCKGYLIDAVSITECLHPFCKSCIVKYLEEKYDCPSCGILIHQSHPLNYISFDRTLQDIVYKVVPNLREREIKSREEFYHSMGKTPPASEDLSHDQNDRCPNPSGVTAVSHETTDAALASAAANAHDPDHHRHDEQVNIQLEPGSDNLQPLAHKFLRLSSRATVTHLRKYVAQQVLHDISRFRDIDIFILNTEDGTFLGRDHVLKFVRVVYWHGDQPMPLQYRHSRRIY
ncbi:Polycomb group RING finger protein 3 [Fasciolopsis buskii]|uniref:Polycomb group RING finger protein 3 n=1 Tax=Fasciolopsis buskii TaxID=27845 RepID=A0A8E0VLW7_9TREM|nr:Polycomb group RING finger protein 3 [Fasciolopsis buski]